MNVISFIRRFVMHIRLAARLPRVCVCVNSYPEDMLTYYDYRTRGPSVRLCRIGRPLRHIAVLRAGEVTLRRSCVWYVGRGVVPLTGRDR